MVGCSLSWDAGVGLTALAVGGGGAAEMERAAAVGVGLTGPAVGVGGAAETEGAVAVGVGLTGPAVGVSDDRSRQPASHTAAAHSSTDAIHPTDFRVSTQLLPSPCASGSTHRLP